MRETNEDGRKTDLTIRRDSAIKEAGPERVYGWVEAGVSTRDIARKLNLGGDDTAMWAVQNWLRQDEDRYEKAKRRSVEAHMEKAGEVYGDEAPESTADAKWRNDRSGFHRWVAELRAGLRNKDGTTVNVNLGQLHLDALRRKGSMSQNPDRVEPRSRPEPIEGEYRVEDGKSAQDDYPASVK